MDVASQPRPAPPSSLRNLCVSTLSFSFSSALYLSSATVRISIISKTLRFLYFHTLTNSFASRKMLSPMASSTSALFAQNTRVGVPMRSFRRFLACYPSARY